MYTKSLIVDEGDRLLENWGSQISNVEKGIGPMDYQRKIVLSRILESANQHIGRARQVMHLRQVPFLTIVRLPHEEQISPV